MTHGKHVTAAECEEMRRRYRNGWFGSFIARDLGYNRNTVYYHLRGNCSHWQSDENERADSTR